VKISLVVLDMTLVGGIERVAANMAVMLSARGHEVTIHSFFKTNERPFYSVGRKVKIDYLSGRNFTLSGKLGMIPLYVSMIRNARTISARGGDIYISLFTNASILLSLFGNIRVPFIAAEHGQYYAHGLIVRLLRRIAYRRVDAVVALTKTDASIYSKIFGGKGRCIPNGISDIPDMKSTGSGKSITAAGRLVREKGYDLLIPMAEKFLSSEKGWNVLIYGEGYERDKLASLIENSPAGNRIVLHGFEKNLSRALAKSSIYLCTSHTESFGMAIAEAMACALPVVSFDCPTGPRDIIENGKNGFLVPVGDEAQFVEKVIHLMRDEKLRKRMGMYARKSVEKFLPDRIAVMWEDLFKSLRRLDENS